MSYSPAYYQANKPRIKAQAAAWYRANKPRHKEIGRKHELKRLYGITPEDYNRMLEAQGYACAICFSEPWTCVQGTLSVDHDHRTGRVRGLLCDKCNRAIGLLGDDPSRTLAATFYLGGKADNPCS